MKNFKEILTEKMSVDECEKKFGEFLFGSFKGFYKKEVEKDTPIEKDVFKRIIKFVQGEYVDAKKDEILIKALMDLKDCKNKYKQILEPDKTELYRGTIVKKSELKNMDKCEKKYYLKGTYTYKGKSKIQSWSPSFASAGLFAEVPDYKESTHIPAILKYNFPKKSLLFNTKFLNAMAQYNDYGDEDEIIRIENTPIKCEIYVFESDYK